MLSKMFIKLKMFLTDERTTEEKIKSCESDISNYRWMAIAFGISFLYTSICYFIFPTYIPEWFPFLDSTWISLRNSWVTHLVFMLVSVFLWISEIKNKKKLLKSVV